jgi:O-antigen/teichoic acid export membrane protein
MRINGNLLTGLASSIWSALVALAVVPFYIKYLGVESYGLIGFFVTAQALIQLLDMGIAPTINREVARCSASGNLEEAAKLLHSLAVVYWTIAGTIALLVVSLAPLIAGYWLQSTDLSNQTIEHAVMLMGLVLACRWPIALYQAALMGAQRLSVSSTINIMMVTLGSIGAVGVITFVSPTIVAFFMWQACVGIVYTFTIRWAAWGVIGGLKERQFDVDAVKRIWRFSVGMGGIALSGLMFTQLDKIVLSKMLGLEEFGHYMLATAVVSGLYVLIMPTYNVVYPRMSAHVAKGETEQLINLYQSGSRMFATVLFPCAMVLAVFGEDLVRVWTGNLSIASNVAPVISLLAIGSALNGVMFFPYALQLAYGMTWIPLIINMGLMCLLVPLVIFLAHTYGALGGAMAWLTSQAVYVLLAPWITHRYVLKGLAPKWLFQDISIPLAFSVLVGLAGHYAIQGTDHSVYVKLMGGLALMVVAVLPTFWLSPQLRSIAWDYMGWKKYA